jgi:hypothetical protein
MAWWRSGQLTPNGGLLRSEANLVCDGPGHRSGFFGHGKISDSCTLHAARNRKGDVLCRDGRPTGSNPSLQQSSQLSINPDCTLIDPVVRGLWTNRKPYPHKRAGTFQAAGSLLDADDHRVRSDQIFHPGFTESCFPHPRCTISPRIVEPVGGLD